MDDYDIMSQRLSEAVEANSHMPPAFGCEYNNQTGAVECSFICPEGIVEGYKCPEREYWSNKRALSRLESRFALGLVFREPALALGNDLLEDDGLYSHQLVSWQ